MKQLLFTILLSCLLAYTSTKAQNVGIGTTTPNASAILDISSNTKGVLLPRMNTAQRNAIASPAMGLIIFNTDDMCTDIYDGANWIKTCGLKQGDSATIPANNWVQKANFGGTARFSAVCFAIGNKGYIGTGNDGTYKKDFWEVQPNDNIWTQKADFAGSERYNATAFSINDKGYVCTGFDGNNLNDLWEYNVNTNVWLQKSSINGFSGVQGAVSFSIGNKGYLGTGFFGVSTSTFFEYDPNNDTWTQKANFGGTPRYGAVGFSIGSKGYIGTGLGGIYKNDFWEYDPGTAGSLGVWTQKAPFGGTPRYAAVGFSIGSKGYIGTGYDEMGLSKNDFWEYDPSTNEWIQKANFGGTARRSAVGFSIGSKGYLSTGVNGLFNNDFWEYNTLPINVAAYSTLPATLSQSNVSDASWTKTVLGEIKSNIGNVNIVNGKLGVGTTSPTETLDVTGKTKTTNLQITNGAAVNKILTSDATGNASWQSPPTTPINYWTASSNNINNNNTGNVGIGFISPVEKLHIDGNIKLGNNFWQNSSNDKTIKFGDGNLVSIGERFGDDELHLFGGHSISLRTGIDNVAIRIDNNRNVGIGNTNPAYILDLSKRIRLRSENTSQGAGIWFNNNDNTAENIFLGNDVSNNLQVFSLAGNRTIATFNPISGGLRVEGPTTAASGSAIASFGGNGDFEVDKPGTVGGRFVIKENGNMGIGLTIPQTKLDILSNGNNWNNNGMSFSDINANRYFLYKDLSNSFHIGFNGTKNLTISNGNVGIGNDNPTQKLVVNGNILASGTITPSDIRYKKDIRVIPNAIKKLLQLNGVYYNLKTNEFPQMCFSKNEQVGLLAQEVEKVMPNVVVTNTDGYKGVDYAKLIPLLIESIKELKKELDEQHKLIKQLLKNK